jgi:hypothetical protein
MLQPAQRATCSVLCVCCNFQRQPLRCILDHMKRFSERCIQAAPGHERTCRYAVGDRITPARATALQTLRTLSIQAAARTWAESLVSF